MPEMTNDDADLLSWLSGYADRNPQLERLPAVVRLIDRLMVSAAREREEFASWVKLQQDAIARDAGSLAKLVEAAEARVDWLEGSIDLEDIDSEERMESLDVEDDATGNAFRAALAHYKESR